MKAIFLAFAFREETRHLVDKVDRLVLSHGLQLVTGERLGGEQLTTEVVNRIKKADGLIALLTKDEALQNGGWKSRQWVHDEFGVARNSNKLAIAVVEKGVNVGGAYASNECLPYDASDPLPAFLALSENLAEWKRRTGRVIKVQILPDSLGKNIMNGATVSYRLIQEGQPQEWRSTMVFEEGKGIFISVKGVQDDVLVQCQVKVNQTRWSSFATPPTEWMSLQLHKGNNGEI
jgi:hypothetical protein